MPKRPNPFGEASPLQYKTHVGKKEVDLGVNMEENMRLVYEKTKSLLYEGSKKATDCHSCCEAQDWSALATREELCVLPGQMRINDDGQLCEHSKNSDVNLHQSVVESKNDAADGMEIESDHLIENGHASSKLESTSKQLTIDNTGKLCARIKEFPTHASSGCRICQSCNRPVHMVPRQCTFCDKATCSNCLLQCCSCRGIFCKLCCVMNYDTYSERSFCLQCTN